MSLRLFYKKLCSKWKKRMERSRLWRCIWRERMPLFVLISISVDKWAMWLENWELRELCKHIVGMRKCQSSAVVRLLHRSVSDSLFSVWCCCVHLREKERRVVSVRRADAVIFISHSWRPRKCSVSWLTVSFSVCAWQIGADRLWRCSWSHLLPCSVETEVMLWYCPILRVLLRCHIDYLPNVSGAAGWSSEEHNKIKTLCKNERKQKIIHPANVRIGATFYFLLFVLKGFCCLVWSSTKYKGKKNNFMQDEKRNWGKSDKNCLFTN